MRTISYSIFLFIVVLSLNIVAANAQQQKVLYNAASMQYDKSIAPDAWRLLGNVVFTDRAARMYCDSAYFFEKTQDINAFGHIRIYPDSKGNTTLTGNILHYKATDRIANITGNVVLVDDSATLTTQTIFYNMTSGVADYPGKGKIVQGKTIIISDKGAYNKYF